jgi:hypothetical protein
LRDALTLFDECGIIVYSNKPELLKLVAQRCWTNAFQADDFKTGVQLSICGHAMLEKYLAPYKSMTAKALLISTPGDFQQLPREEQLNRLDRVIAKRMLAGELLNKPACLTPLPLSGIPGWWPGEAQDDEFYGDLQVFRPPPSALIPASIIEL